MEGGRQKCSTHPKIVEGNNEQKKGARNFVEKEKLLRMKKM
jgi:hypothetical protein